MRNRRRTTADVGDRIGHNVLFQFIGPPKAYITEVFVGLYNDHIHGELKLVVPKCVQAEMYGLRRAGRTNKKVNEKWVPAFYEHNEIVDYFMRNYPAIFDIDFLKSLAEYEWQAGDDASGNGNYKQSLLACLTNEYGWIQNLVNLMKSFMNPASRT